jgi:hypothetical protein
MLERTHIGETVVLLSATITLILLGDHALESFWATENKTINL